MSVSQDRQSVLITGCTPGGIGHALAKEFHSKGLHVIATARRPEVLQELSDMGMTAIQLEVTDSESIKACKKQVEEITGGRLDILVNNAGKSCTMTATDVDLDDVRKTYETNVFAIMAMVQAFVPLLIPTRGTIVMISSLASVSPYIFRSVYASSKAALNSYSRCLRQELRPFGIRVLVSLTGTVRSNFATFAHTPELPPTSIYRRISELFKSKVRFSQENGTADTTVFARKLAAEVLKGEGWFGGLIGGTRKWLWAGGLSFKVWLARTLFGEWLLDILVYRMFDLHKHEALLREDQKKRVE